MCGIAGAIGVVDEGVEAAVRQMTNAQTHRGPDDSGFYSSGPGLGATFGFRRLAIIDPTPAGHQPMVDPERDTVLVFNGEIYNYAELRRELESFGEVFRSTSDTEVLLRAYSRWGEKVLPKLTGMFAFAIYDRRRRSVFLARDRLGIKPLYLAEVARPEGRVVLFASELRALLESGLVPRRLNPTALGTYAWNGFVVGPPAIIEGVSQLPPATSTTIKPGSGVAEVTPYWSLGEKGTSEGDGRERLEAELFAAARRHLASDVPLGIFLSGGVDSSAVAALAVRATGSRLKTFHVAFEESGFDESSHARAVAHCLGTDHSEFHLTQGLFQAGIEKALAAIDQPTFDAINTYFISQVVRDAGFSVALSGTGGDELFGGYRSFRDLPRVEPAVKAAALIPQAVFDGIARFASSLRARKGLVSPQTRWAKVGDLLRSRGDRLAAYQTAYALYTREFLAELASESTLALVTNGLPVSRAAELRELTKSKSSLSAIGLFELSLFLGERLLRDMDTTSMAVSLELRVPLLDHRVVEAVHALPDSIRFRPLGKKKLLRSLALSSLPSELFDRPKAGFVLPIEVWAKDKLAADLEGTFADRELTRRVGLNTEALVKLLRSFRAGDHRIYWSRIWAPYVLLRWCQAHGASLG
jgi:asparagine synthase (glutamine-hydrolysing)